MAIDLGNWRESGIGNRESGIDHEARSARNGLNLPLVITRWELEVRNRELIWSRSYPHVLVSRRRRVGGTLVADDAERL